MKRLLLAFAAIALCATSAHAVDLNSKKGIGYASTISGVNGINFQMGVGNLILEGILGVTMASEKDADQGLTNLGLGLGAHFQALRAEKAAWTVGGRLNVGYLQPPVKDADAITEFGISIPTRVYWFPNKHISLHVETGIDLQFPGEDGAVTSTVASPEGTAFLIFDVSSGIGMTFWW
jgi:hypothetical protein